MISIEQLTGIRAFVETARAGSFTLASERLALSRSAVGKAVARLEAQLDTRLLHRTTRQVTLTDDGKRFLQHCTHALIELEKGETALKERHGAVAGPLRVEVPLLFGRQWIAPVLLELAREHPALQLDMTFSNRLNALNAGQIDLAVRIGALPDSPNLVARPLGVQDTLICAAPLYLKTHGTPATPQALLTHACLAEGADARSSGWTLSLDGELRAYPLQVRLVLRDAMALKDAALAGFGLARLPRWLVADSLQAGHLVEVLAHARAPGLPIHILRTPTPYPLLRQRVAIDRLLARFLPNPPWQ